MIEETAVVSAVENGYAWVETQRKSACAACNLNKGCGTSVLAKVLGGKRSRLRVLNRHALKPGDVVVIGLEETALVRGSLALYAFPLLAMFIGAGLGFAIFHGMDAQYSDGWQALFSLAGLAGGFFLLRRFTAAWHRSRRYQPVVLRRISRGLGQPLASNA